MQVRIQSDADSVITRDENDNRMKSSEPNGGEMVMVESSAKSDSPSVELNVDESEGDDDDDDDDGYSHFKSTSVISVIENKTTATLSCSDDNEEGKGNSSLVSFQGMVY